MAPPEAEEGCLADSLASVSTLSEAGLSSEQMILTAALILPSSILAETTSASEEASSLRLLAGAPTSLTSDSKPAVDQSFRRFLMTLVKLCRFPPLVGLMRLMTAKLNNLDQQSKSSIEWVILVRRLDRTELHAGLADLGMCLMIGKFDAGWLKCFGARD